MLKILKYSFYDLIRSRWSYVYFLFYLALGFVLLFLNNDVSKAVITLMNVIIVLIPLIGTIFGVMTVFWCGGFIDTEFGFGAGHPFSFIWPNEEQCHF